MMGKEKALDPLKELLGDVLHRLEALEAAAGVSPPQPDRSVARKPSSTTAAMTAGA